MSNEPHERVKTAVRVPWPIRAIMLGLVFGAIAYWTTTYSGPYRWLTELQLSLLDESHPILTVILILLVMVVVMAVVLDGIAPWFCPRGKAALTPQETEQLLRRHGPRPPAD